MGKSNGARASIPRAQVPPGACGSARSPSLTRSGSRGKRGSEGTPRRASLTRSCPPKTERDGDQERARQQGAQRQALRDPQGDASPSGESALRRLQAQRCVGPTCVWTTKDADRSADPRWASTNLGCFLCIRCSGIHRSMGVHISRSASSRASALFVCQAWAERFVWRTVKSIDLDTWTPEQVALVQRWGNKRANLYWEAHLRPGHMPPDQCVALSASSQRLALTPVPSKIESFIRSKYESRRWAMEGPLPDPDTLDDGPAPTEPAPSSTSTGVPPKTARPVVKPSTDLLGESPAATPPPSAPAPTSASKPVPSSSGGGLFDLDFSPEASSAAAKATAPAARKDVKNDILSLFASPSSKPAPFPPQQQPQQSPPPPAQTGGGLWSAGSQFGSLNTVPAAPVQTPAHAGFDGMSNHFANMSVASSDPWGGFASATTSTGSAVPPSPTRARAQTRQSSSGQFGFGEGLKVRLSLFRRCVAHRASSSRRRLKRRHRSSAVSRTPGLPQVPRPPPPLQATTSSAASLPATRPPHPRAGSARPRASRRTTRLQTSGSDRAFPHSPVRLVCNAGPTVRVRDAR